MTAAVEAAARQDTIPPEAKRLITYLTEAQWSATTRNASWDRLKDFWKGGHEIKFGDFPEYEDLRLTRLTRNAIAHRLGEYTKEYTTAAQKKLRALGVDPMRATGLIPLEDEDVLDAVAVARRFVLWLDAQL